MRKTTLLICALMSFVSACGTVPNAPTQVQVVCPRLPEIEVLDPETAAALALSFTGQMESFLQGLLPAPTNYELRSGPAAPNDKLTLTP